jgi:hypothetical protein
MDLWAVEAKPETDRLRAGHLRRQFVSGATALRDRQMRHFPCPRR